MTGMDVIVCENGNFLDFSVGLMVKISRVKIQIK